MEKTKTRITRYKFFIIQASWRTFTTI